MIKFYLKIQNNMLTKNLLYIVTGIVLFFNIIIRVFPREFINMQRLNMEQSLSITVVPIDLFTYCDVYLLLLFVILIFFFLGTDFNNSMEEIALTAGGSRINKFMARKLMSLLLLYLILYSASYINIYTLYIRLIKNNRLIPLEQIIVCSAATNIFIISLSLFILLLTREIAVSTSIITAFYLLEETLWRCKVTDKYGILGHLYQYIDYKRGELFEIRVIYILISIILLFFTYELSKRKVSFGLKIRKALKARL